DHGHSTLHQIAHQFRQPSVIIVGEAEFDRHIAAFDEACFVQAFAERGHNTCTQLRRTGIYKSNHRQRRLLRARCERPCCCRAAKQRDELAPLHSITSSTKEISRAGISMASALAVLRLITNSNLVSCWTGRSAGLSPLRMRPV